MSVIGWSGSASVLTFQKPIHREESHHVGNIHYRHLPGYRLEVKTAGSGASSRAELRNSALGVREFLIFLGWNGQGDRPLGSAADARWERIRTSWGALFASREAEARYRCRAREAGIAVESIQEPRRRRRLRFACQSSESLESPKGRPPEKGMIMIAGSMAFGRL